MHSKINVHATSEVFTATKQRVTQAELDVKKLRYARATLGSHPCHENTRFLPVPQHMSHLIGKPTICIGENKDSDQLRGNREADQRLCFRFSDSTIPLLLKSEISSF